MGQPLSSTDLSALLKQVHTDKSPRCARCQESVKNRKLLHINGVAIGPHCSKRYHQRVKLRQQGSGSLFLSICNVCGFDYLFREATATVCPRETCCLHCQFFGIESHGEFCALEKFLGASTKL